MRPQGRWSSSTIDQRVTRAGLLLRSIRTRTRWNDRKPSVVVFDVNETLIDIEALNPLFERVFGDRRVLREWFGQLVLYSMTTTLSGHYEDFFALGRGVFEMVGAVHGVASASYWANKSSTSGRFAVRRIISWSCAMRSVCRWRVIARRVRSISAATTGPSTRGHPDCRACAL